MKVLLSGYNLDSSTIDELKQRSGWTKDNITPETLSAAYARISRDPRDIEELRKEAREEVDKSRKSNETIIFGLGHSSVAEHAYFNFDIIGLSRFAVEQVQKFRMASFTEKSQRYITLDDDFVVPKEIKDAGFENKFVELIKYQNENYHILYKALQEYLFDKHADIISTKNGKRTVDGWAKEDARYVVSMATESQFGMSINARSLENMLRQLRNSELLECRELSQKLYDLVKDISPSIIKYIEPTDYDKNNSILIEKFISNLNVKRAKKGKIEVELVDHTPEPDRKIAEIIFSSIGDLSSAESSKIASSLEEKQLKTLFKVVLENRTPHDPLKRYFEFADATFDLIVSSSNYAQLKRHRVASMLTDDYDISLGFTMPKNIKIIGMEDKFNEVMKATDKFYRELTYFLPYHAQYVLTNAHRRRVKLKMNFREIYHFMSLRLDEHAQWDIKNTAEKMLGELNKIAPYSTMMCCGKSDFTKKLDKIFG
jgi:flavin-dependent thymidylate synthase